MIDDETVARVVEFHGHMCAGLALGIRAAEIALAEVGRNRTGEDVVAVVETDMCAVDAIQFLTGCTFGKGNLVHRDHGKSAYTFIRRADGKAVRVSPRPDGPDGNDPIWLALFARVRTGTATAEDKAAFIAGQRQRSARILEAPLDGLYEVRRVNVAAPPPARVMASLDCDACGERAAETRIRHLDGQSLCLPCFEDALAGDIRLSLMARSS